MQTIVCMCVCTHVCMYVYLYLGMYVCKSGPAIRHGGVLVESRYISYSFLTSALEGGEWSASRPGRTLTQEEGPPVPIVQEGGWAPEPVWT
jgi:hypothetical protein